MTRIAVPALVVMVAVAATIAVAGWNRSGEPRLTIVLTERELQMPRTTGPAPDEDPGLRLRLAIEQRRDPLDTRNWLPESRLREIGFPMEVRPGNPSAPEVYDKVPSRLAWVVLEYDGPAWREIDRRRELQASGPRVPLPVLQSRLVPVDAGLDFDALRERYPSGHLIVRAIIGMRFVPASEGGPLLQGMLWEIVPPAITVPQHLRPVFDDLPPPSAEDGEQVPRYEAEIAIGRLGVPYLRSARRR